MSKKKPKTNDISPANGTQMPSAESPMVSAKSQQPTDESQVPAAGNQQPTAESQQHGGTAPQPRKRRSVARRIARWAAAIVCTPIALFLLLAIALYLPPVQRWAVDKATAMVEEETGLHAEMEYVRLAFPLDLVLHDFLLTDPAGKGRAMQPDETAFSDTVCTARDLRLHIPLMPLFSLRADVDGLSLAGARVDTRDLVGDLRIKGTLEALDVTSKGIEFTRGAVRLNRVAIASADLAIWLNDTAAVDTSTTSAAWQIALDAAEVRDARIQLAMPHGEMRVGVDCEVIRVKDGAFDTGQGAYGVAQATVKLRQVAYDIPSEPCTATGLDVNHLLLSDVVLSAGKISYREPMTLDADLRKIALRERSGFSVSDLYGQVHMDDERLRVPALRMQTPTSQVALDVDLDWRALSQGADADLHVAVDATVSRADIASLAGGFLPEGATDLLPAEPLTLQATLSGNMDEARAQDVVLSWPKALTVKGDATLRHLLDDRLSAEASLSAVTGNLSCIQGLLPDGVAIPAGLSLNADVAYSAQSVSAKARAALRGGTLDARASLRTAGEVYGAEVQANAFPVASFMPSLGLSPLTARVEAKGAGFDFLSRRTRANADVQIGHLSYGDLTLDGSHLTADLRDGHANVDFAALTPLLNARGGAEATIGEQIDATLHAKISDIDLLALGVAKDTLACNGDFSLSATAKDDFSAFSATGGLTNICFVSPRTGFTARDLGFAFETSPQQTSAHVSAGDLEVALASPTDLSALLADVGAFTDDIAGDELPLLLTRAAGPEALQTLRGHLEGDSATTISFLHDKIDRLRPLALPSLDLDLQLGEKNPAYAILHHFGYDLRNFRLNLSCSPDAGLSGVATAGGVDTGTLLLDTMNVTLSQTADGLQLLGHVCNYTKTNPNRFELSLEAQLLTTGASVAARLLDADGREGLNLGARCDVTDAGLRLSLTPHEPVLAYRRFEVNRDNFVLLGRGKELTADIDLLADDGTGLKLYGAPNERGEGDLTLSLSHVNLSELSAVVPGMPALGGFLSGDAHVTLADSSFTSAFALQTEDFALEGTTLGSFDLEGFLLPKENNSYEASAFLLKDEEEVLAINGTYWAQDDPGRFAGDATLTQFPLEILNGYLVGTDIALKGEASGHLDVQGTLDEPRMNGSLDLGAAHVLSDVYGFDFRLDDDEVQIADSRLVFDHYDLFSTGTEPLTINGDVDLRNLSAIATNLALNATNFELINTQKKKASMIYGRMFVDFAGTLTGTLDDLRIKGNIDILDRTNLTYILKDSPLTVDDQLAGLVQFTSFTDTTLVEEEPVGTSAMNMTLGLNIADGARFHCLLSEDGSNYVDVQGGGGLVFRLTSQNEMLLTGRFTMTAGEMKYSLPVIPLKTFTLADGSYVEFTGDVLSPALSIKATERVKAVVTENDVSRSVPFDVGVDISGTLEKMGLAFIIDAADDLSVQNQLASMTDEERGKVAVTMLATGMYLTDESMMNGSGFKASNALNAFLQSEIQNIAGSALKSVDLSLGIESGTSEVGTTTTDYSFQFAKRFWGDRISVIIGGKVSTGADAENSAETFIDNVAVEYRLDRSATRYVQAFYDRATRDVFEGQLTRTGVGLLLRRKTDKLGELFIFRKKK